MLPANCTLIQRRDVRMLGKTHRDGAPSSDARHSLADARGGAVLLCER